MLTGLVGWCGASEWQGTSDIQYPCLNVSSGCDIFGPSSHLQFVPGEGTSGLGKLFNWKGCFLRVNTFLFHILFTSCSYLECLAQRLACGLNGKMDLISGLGLLSDPISSGRLL